MKHRRPKSAGGSQAAQRKIQNNALSPSIGILGQVLQVVSIAKAFRASRRVSSLARICHLPADLVPICRFVPPLHIIQSHCHVVRSLVNDCAYLGDLTHCEVISANVDDKSAVVAIITARALCGFATVHHICDGCSTTTTTRFSLVDIINIVEHIFNTVEISLDLCSRSPIVLPVILKDFRPDAPGTHLVERRLYETLRFHAISDHILFPIRDVLLSPVLLIAWRRRRWFPTWRGWRVAPWAATVVPAIAIRPRLRLFTTNCGGTPRLVAITARRARPVAIITVPEWKLAIISSSTAGQR